MHFASLTVVAPRVFSSHCGDFLIGMVAGFSFGEDFECFQWEWRCWGLCSFLTGAFVQFRFFLRASPRGARKDLPPRVLEFVRALPFPRPSDNCECGRLCVGYIGLAEASVLAVSRRKSNRQIFDTVSQSTR